MGVSKQHIELTRYLEGLTLHGGDLDGAPLTVLAWERRLLRGVWGRVGNGALSVARGNGKSALVAGIAAAVVDPAGPLTGPRREVVCCAASFEQSRVIFEDVLAFLGDFYNLDDRTVWRKQDSANRAWLECRLTGARVRCIGSDPATAHGLRPYLVLADEPAQWKATDRDKMLAAIKTGLGKTPGSRMLALGTRPADDAHWFARQLKGEGVVYAQVHAAPLDAPPFALSTLRKGNPSLDHLPSLKAELMEEAHLAAKDSGALASYRALRLNQGVEDVESAVLLDADVWKGIEGDAEMRGPMVWGIDLGTSAAQSAIAAFWLNTGALRALAAFPVTPALGERGLRDGVGRLYVDCAARGELLQFGTRAVDVSALLGAALARFGMPAAVVADQWRIKELVDAMEKAGIPLPAFATRRMGWKDGSQDVREFRRACLEGNVTPQPSLLLRSAMAAARTVSDASGNVKLAKSSEGGRRLRARDDAAAAAILAVSLGVRNPGPEASTGLAVVG